MTAPPHPRRDPRVTAVLEVRYRNAGQFLVSYCTNLSRGGLFVSTPKPAPVGTRLVLSMGIPGLRTPASLTAIVRWVRPAPDETGPAGMGLSFEQIDQALGGHIDRIVARAEPLRIELVGRPDRAWRHVAALVRSLVSCQPRQHAFDRLDPAQLMGADLVLVDVDGAPTDALALLTRLQETSNPPPVLALCAARNVEMRRQASRMATVIATPVDSETLQTTVLDALGSVSAFVPE